MKYILATAFICFSSIGSFAQNFKNDSLKIQAEINQITDMVDNRNNILADYNRSLTTHTGFLGNRTNEDEQNSTNILLNVVKDDNNIIAQFNSLSSDLNAYVIKQKRLSVMSQDLIDEYDKKFSDQRKLTRILAISVGVLFALALISLFFSFRRKRSYFREWRKLD
jgi:hypothetical protein